MEIGKLPNEVLEEIVLDNLKHQREEVLIHAGIGKDCAVIDFGEKGCIVTSDPITGASKNIGKLAVHISCNDIATTGGEPIGLVLTMLLPKDTTIEEVKEIIKDASEESKRLNVEIIGGHTEITDAVNKVVLVTTVIGMHDIDKIVGVNPDIKPGDKLIITKAAGIEGTSIIAYDLEEKLKGKISERLIQEGKDLSRLISVVKDGMIAAENGAKYMHDITEGGVLGAVWEAAISNNVGIRIFEEKIPVKESTVEMSKLLNINYLSLISSGSMLIISDSESADKIVSELAKEKIDSAIIGEILDSSDVVIAKDGKEKAIESPGSDEIYKVI